MSQPGFCPQCGAQLSENAVMCQQCGSSPASTFSGEEIAKTVMIALALFVVLAAVLLAFGFRLYQKILAQRRALAKIYSFDRGAPLGRGALDAPGPVYLIPLGEQAVPIETLAKHYENKFGLKVGVLPQMPLDPSWQDRKRHQYRAETLIDRMQHQYFEHAAEPNAVLIGITDADIFTSDWGFTYSLRHNFHTGVVSTHRMSEEFWGGRGSPQRTEAATLQMLTKYVALLHARYAISFDPRSVLYQPFTPNGGSDDVFESDLHPEFTPLGKRGDSPRLSFSYSHREHSLVRSHSGIEDCSVPNVFDVDEEFLTNDLHQGLFLDYKSDFSINSRPELVFVRVLRSQDNHVRAMGLGGSHSFDPFLASSKPTGPLGVDFVSESGSIYTLRRTDGGTASTPAQVYEGKEDGGYSGGRMTEVDHKMKFDLPTGGSYLFQNGAGGLMTYPVRFTDWDGKVLEFERKGNDLLRAAAGTESIRFQYDNLGRMTMAEDDHGRKIIYEYGENGRISRIQYPDGWSMYYKTDPNGNYVQVSTGKGNTPPKTLMEAQYDADARVIQEEIVGIGVYKIRYFGRDRVEVTEPDGRIDRIFLRGPSGEFALRASPVKH